MPRDKEYFVDILESARLAMNYLKDKTKEALLADIQLQDSVVRRLEIIGEAARRVSREGIATVPNLPWKNMISLRNVLIHEYDAVDLTIVWDTVKRDLPLVVAELEKIVETETKS